MDLTGVLELVAALAIVALTAGALYGISELVKTMRSSRVVLDDLHERLPVVLEDADVSLNALTLELMRLDGILDDVERVTDTAAGATRAAEEAVQVPLQKAAAYAERFRKTLSSARGKKQTVRSNTTPVPEPAAEQVTADAQTPEEQWR